MEVTPRLRRPSWRWMTLSGTPSWASSIACAWRSWWGAKRRRTPPHAAARREPAQHRARWGGLPRAPAGGTVDDAEQRTDGHGAADGQPGLELLEAPVVHADLAAAAAFAAADEHRAAT